MPCSAPATHPYVAAVAAPRLSLAVQLFVLRSACLCWAAHPNSALPYPSPAVRHAPSSQACGAAGGSVAGSEGSDGDGESQRFLSFEVLDTGVGVSRRALESLFQDYVQASRARGWDARGGVRQASRGAAGRCSTAGLACRACVCAPCV